MLRARAAGHARYHHPAATLQRPFIQTTPSIVSAVELPWRSPDALLAAYGDEPWSVLLDSGGEPGPRARWSVFCCRPTATLQGEAETDWHRLEALLPERIVSGILPFAGGIIGLISYEAGLTLEGVVSRHAPVLPGLNAARYDGALVFDRQTKRLWWNSACNAPMNFALPACSVPAPLAPHVTFTPDLDEASWCDAVRDLIARINQGELFQANLTTQWRAALPGPLSPAGLYRQVRRASPAPFGACFVTPGHALLSASVERFLSMDAQGLIETRPIKGTARLGVDTQEDRQLAEALAHDEKEYAENLMITDLMRNDIGRVCTIGSVHVPALCAVERFAHVHHLVSSVTGQIRPGLTALDLLRATLPPGSVTGAPKHRALQVIDRLERSARGVYCGSLFRIGADGALDSSVIIRSLCLTAGQITLGAGGGITTLSHPMREFEEMCLKAAPLLGVFS